MGNLMGKNSEIGTLFTQHRMPPLCERADASKLHGSTWNFARTQLRLWGVVLCSRHAKKRMPENRRSILVSWVIFEIRHTLNLSLQRRKYPPRQEYPKKSKKKNENNFGETATSPCRSNSSKVSLSTQPLISDKTLFTTEVHRSSA